MRKFPSIKKNEDFRQIYRTGKSCANEALVMYIVFNDTDSSRLGISVSKKVGNSVVRHHIARLLRECFRLHLNQMKSGYDIVVVARQPAAAMRYEEMSHVYLNLCSRMGILL